MRLIYIALIASALVSSPARSATFHYTQEGFHGGGFTAGRFADTDTKNKGFHEFDHGSILPSRAPGIAKVTSFDSDWSGNGIMPSFSPGPNDLAVVILENERSHLMNNGRDPKSIFAPGPVSNYRAGGPGLLLVPCAVFVDLCDFVASTNPPPHDFDTLPPRANFAENHVIPLPAAAWLFLTALGALGLAKRFGKTP